jgi:hypothetical protein
MTRRFLLLILLFVCTLPFTMLAAVKDVVPAGTILQCTMDEPNFSAKTAMVGDPVLCHLGQLSSFGHSVFPRGALLGGHLQDFQNPGHFVGKGWMSVEFDHLILPGTEMVPLSAKVISAPHMKADPQGNLHGKGHPKRDALLWAVPVFWPIKVLTLPARGPYPAFKGESRLSLRVMEDIEVPFPVASKNSVPMPPWERRGSYEPSSSLIVPASSNMTPTLRTLESVKPNPQVANGADLAVIALNSGNAFLARRYWIESDKLHCVSEGGVEQAFPLDAINLSKTMELNQERNVEVVLQSRGTVEQ